jgi:hypothetical protein
MATMNKRAAKRNIFYSLLLDEIFPHCPKCSKAPIFAAKLRFLAEETDGFRSSSIRKPMVSTAETDGFHGRNQWFPRRKPLVSFGKAPGNHRNC